MAIIPDLPLAQPGSNIAGDGSTRYWANGWPATTIVNPRDLQTLQESPFKGGMFRNKFRYLFENLDLINDFFDGNINVGIFDREEQMFPPWTSSDQLAWGAYVGMVLRTIISADPDDPAPGILPPYGIRWNMLHYQGLAADPDVYGWEHELKYINDNIPVVYGFSETQNNATCPIYIYWDTHDQWRIYHLQHIGEIGGWYDYEDAGVKAFWGQEVFSDKYTLFATGSIVDHRLIDCPLYMSSEYDAQAPFPIDKYFTNNGTTNMAGGWVLLTCHAEYSSAWESLEGWNPGEVILPTSEQSGLYLCDL
jgi:hypothetical protein